MRVDIHATLRESTIQLERMIVDSSGPPIHLIMERFEPGIKEERGRGKRDYATCAHSDILTRTFCLLAVDWGKKAAVIVRDIRQELTQAWEASLRTRTINDVGPGHADGPDGSLQSMNSAGPSMKSRPYDKDQPRYLPPGPYHPSPNMPTHMPGANPQGYYTYGAPYYSTHMHGHGVPPGGPYQQPAPTYNPSGMPYNGGWAAPAPPIAPPPLPATTFGKPAETKASVPAERVKTPPVLPPPRPLNSFTANMVIPAFKGGSTKKPTDPVPSHSSYAAFKNASPALSAFAKGPAKPTPPPPGPSERRP